MKKQKSLLIFFIIFFCGISCCFAIGEKTSPMYNFSLDEAIGIAFKNNKDIQIQEQEVTAAKAFITEARSVFLPNVSANAGYTHTGTVLTMPLAISAKKDIGIFTGYENDNKLGLQIEQNMYNGGANIANLRQSEVKLKIQQETLRARKLDTEFEVKRLYYGLLLAYETERIAQDLYDQAKSHYEDVQKKYEQGTASRFDLLQSKVQISKISPELIKAKNSIDLISAELKKLLGLKMRDEIHLKDSFLYDPIEIKEGEFLQLAYLNKPEMNLRTLGVDVSKWLIAIAKSGYRPQVDANLGYNYSSNNLANMINDRHSNWYAGFSVNVPIFDGFSSKAKVDQAKARYAQANLSKEDLVDQIAVDIRQACLDLKQAAELINSQKDNVMEAKEALSIVNVSYDNGKATNLDVLDTQVSLAQVEKNLSEAIYDYLIAHSSLDRTMGVSIFLPKLEKETKNESKK